MNKYIVVLSVTLHTCSWGMLNKDPETLPLTLEINKDYQTTHSTIYPQELDASYNFIQAVTNSTLKPETSEKLKTIVLKKIKQEEPSQQRKKLLHEADIARKNNSAYYVNFITQTLKTYQSFHTITTRFQNPYDYNFKIEKKHAENIRIAFYKLAVTQEELNSAEQKNLESACAASFEAIKEMDDSERKWEKRSVFMYALCCTFPWLLERYEEMWQDLE